MAPRPDRNMPSSPLSPRVESLAIPSQARRRPPIHTRQSSSGTAANLRLPPLPRFHPANFASNNTSAATTPAAGPHSPQAPPSPRTTSHQRHPSEAQRQIYLQQQLMTNAAAATTRQARASAAAKPMSPRLLPLESPGPVTPMELETADSYLTAGVNTHDAASHVDKLIHEEARRRGEVSPGRATSVGGR